ncbi:Transposase [Quadrisphaera granulorum]|uniref:Transposase n=1 Tax=Quadrisphaera granulorum TaxID=317664 RepID=A0A315ZBC5_9ACTN|nr:transposase [Quadrisphaera granulorum]PWJ42459.1 transposase [Quadrisphaera granulorum]SZE99218.1 Transposase [Quadrisphaera granulorum]
MPPEAVIVGVETFPGTWVQALIGVGYTVYAINPAQAAAYRGRHTSSGAKSDAGDAAVLAEIVRVDRAHHRPIAGDSAQAEGIKLVARAHQSAVARPPTFGRGVEGVLPRRWPPSPPPEWT